MKETFLTYSGFDAYDEYRTYLDRFHKQIVGQKVGIICDLSPNPGRQEESKFSEPMRSLAHACLAIDIEARLVNIETADWCDVTSKMDATLIQSVSVAATSGSLQGCLDVFGKPYSGSGVAATALAFDREWLMAVLTSAGVPVSRSVGPFSGATDENRTVEGSGKSVSRVFVSKKRNILSSGVAFCPNQSAREVLDECGKAPEDLLIEEVDSSRSLCIAAIAVRDGWLLLPPFSHKFPYIDSRPSTIEFPNFHDDRVQGLFLRAAKIIRTIGCYGFVIVEFAQQDSQEVLFDVHLAPSLGPNTAIVQAADCAGLRYESLILSVLAHAYRRNKASAPLNQSRVKA
jgi:D-alanine-D-alanine ligase